MEVVIPPRDHGASTYQYRWDDNGEVTHITRVKEVAAAQERLRRGRQTVQWPFQSISEETEAASSPTTTAAPFARRATWEPKRMARAGEEGDADSITQDLIPDYVINYIRGETPETVARRKRNGGKLAERNVDTYMQHRPHLSRTADFEGFLNDGSSRSGSSGDGNDESRHILSSSREKPAEGGVRRSLAVGWRAGVGLNLILAFLIFLVGFVCLVIAAATGRASGGDSVFFSGSCVAASRINWGLHALVNVVAVALLSGANYVFQALSSPTKAEVSVAHAKKRWLDIGIPSIRNLGHIEGVRTLVVVVLLLSAMATQIIYNAIILTSQTALDYKLVLVTESFLEGASFSNDTTNNAAMLSRLDLLAFQGQAARGELDNLTTSACFEQFGGTFETKYGAVLLITTLNFDDTTSLIQTTSNSRLSSSPSGGRVNINVSRAGNINTLALDKSTIRYCLAQPASNRSNSQPTCQIAVNTPLLGAVTGLHLITIIALSAVLFLPRLKTFNPLATLGDAIASFLQDPDPTTRGACLLSKTDVWQGRWGSSSTSTPAVTATGQAKYFIPQMHFWLSAPSLPRWILFLFLFLVSCALTATALALSVIHDPNKTDHLSPFGTPAKHSTVVLPGSLQNSTAAAAVLAALPQLLLAALYLKVNSLLTIFWLSHELSLFAVGPHKPLRVSSDRPEGSQTSSLYLTLPRPISWALAALFAGMGFVLSQSVFLVPLRLVVAVVHSGGGQEDAETTQTLLAVAFSGVGLFVLIGTLIVLAIAVVGLGLRRAPPAAWVNGEAMGNPMALCPAGTCSAVISSRCHYSATRPAATSVNGLVVASPRSGDGGWRYFGDGGAGQDETELWKKPLVWGAVRHGVGMDVSHAAFTAGDAGMLDVARSYA